MRNRAHVANKAGFTLIECVIAAAILGGALVPIAAVNIQSLNQAEEGEVMTHYLLGAQAKMEEMRATGFGSLSSGTDTYTICRSDIDGDGDPCGDADDEKVSRAWTVTANPGGVFDIDMVQVDVTMGTVTLSTLRANMEP